MVNKQQCRQVSPFLQATKALRESRGIALLCFQTSALEGGEGSASRPSRFLPLGKTRYPLYKRLGGPQGRSGRWKISPTQGLDRRTVQPIAQSLYLLSYPAHNKKVNNTKISSYIVPQLRSVCTVFLDQTVIESHFFNIQYFIMIYYISNALSFIINLFNFIEVNILL